MEGTTIMPDVQKTSQDEINYKELLEQKEQEFEEFKKNTNKGVEKMGRQKNIYEKALDNVVAVAQNPAKLVEIYESEPEVAQKMLDKFYEWITLEEYKEQYAPDTKVAPGAIDANAIIKMAEQKALEKVYQNEIWKSYKSFIKSAWLKESELDNFEKVYNDLTDGKALTPEKVEEYMTIAYRYVAPTWTSQATIEAAKAISTGNSSWGGWSKASSTNSKVDSVKSFYQQHKR